MLSSPVWAWLTVWLLVGAQLKSFPAGAASYKYSGERGERSIVCSESETAEASIYNKELEVQRTAGMKPPAVTVGLSLLAICCLMVPQRGETAGRLMSLQQSEGETLTEDHKSLDDPDRVQALAGDPHPLESSIKAGTDSEGAAQAGKWRRLSIILSVKIQKSETQHKCG